MIKLKKDDRYLLDPQTSCSVCGKNHFALMKHGCSMGNCPQRLPPSPTTTTASDGSTASYYELPEGATELQHLISYKNMNAQIGEIFRSAYRMGEASHSDALRDAKKIKFYIEAEIERLETYETSN